MAMSEEQKKAMSEKMRASHAKKKAEAAEKAKAEAEKAKLAAEATEQEEVLVVQDVVDETATLEEVEVELGTISTGVDLETITKNLGVLNPEPQEEKFSRREVDDIVAKAVASALAQNQPNNIIVKTSSDEMVTLLYIAEVSSRSQLDLRDFGSMTAGTTIDIPKKDFGSRFMTAFTRMLLEKRTLVVLDGLTQDERIRWGVDYKDGEVMDAKFFDRMLTYSADELQAVFSKLCVDHQKCICRRFITAKEKGDNRVSIEKARAINRATKGTDLDGILTHVMKAFGAELQQ